VNSWKLSQIFKTTMGTPVEESEVAKLLYNEMLMLHETGRADLASLHFLGKFLTSEVDETEKFVVRFPDNPELSGLTVFLLKRGRVAQFYTIVDAEESDVDAEVIIFVELRFETWISDFTLSRLFLETCILIFRIFLSFPPR